MNIIVTKVKGGYDFHVEVDGQRAYLGFSLREGKTYGFYALSSQFDRSVKNLLDRMYRRDGLTAAEVRQQAHVLGGIFLAAPNKDAHRYAPERALA